MLKEERQKIILERLKSSEKVNFGELEKILHVSYDSIRRDVIELEDKGLLKKVHGGIVAISYFQALSDNSGEFLGSKELGIIVKKALKLIENQQLILMDGGITNFHIASQLPKNLNATIVTNSPPLAVALNDFPKIEVILLGGHYYKKYQITLGGETHAQVESFRPDLYFMGVNGIDLKEGLTVRNHEEALLKKKMISVSKSIVSCAIDEKINRAEKYKIANTEKLDFLVTNLKANDPLLASFAGIPLRII